MANGNSKILTEEQELKLRKPIEDHVGKIQEKIDSLRVDGTEKVVHLQDRKSTRLNSSHITRSRMPSSA